jgi:hypothetical protein
MTTNRHACANLGVFLLLCGSLLPSCTKITEPVGESNTNWLIQCSDDDACGGDLHCACGLCTTDCASDDACTQHDEGATCTALADVCGSAVPSGGGSACFRGCTDDRDCTSGDARDCRGGVCLAPQAGAGTAPSQEELARAHPEWVACEASAECTLLEPDNCCSICGAREPDDLRVVNGDYAQEAHALLASCTENIGCPAIFCYRQHVLPVCREQRCQIVDIREDETLAGCETDADCTLRAGADCCLCGGGPHPIAIPHRGDVDIETELCGSSSCGEDCEPMTAIDFTARCVGGLCAAIDPPACDAPASGDPVSTHLLVHHSQMGLIMWAERSDRLGVRGTLNGTLEATGSGFPDSAAQEMLDPPVPEGRSWSWFMFRDDQGDLWTFAFTDLDVGFGAAEGSAVGVEVAIGFPPDAPSSPRLTITSGGEPVFYYAIENAGLSEPSSLPFEIVVARGGTTCRWADDCSDWKAQALHVEAAGESAEIAPGTTAIVGGYEVQHFLTAKRFITCLEAPRSDYTAFAVTTTATP